MYSKVDEYNSYGNETTFFGTIYEDDSFETPIGQWFNRKAGSRFGHIGSMVGYIRDTSFLTIFRSFSPFWSTEEEGRLTPECSNCSFNYQNSHEMVVPQSCSIYTFIVQRETESNSFVEVGRIVIE
jgi:hypothetical protein